MDAVNKQMFTEKLNADLRMEFRSIMQYVQHAATIKGARYRDMVRELERHTQQELRHAMALARQIDFLGGRPASTAASFDTVTDPELALRQDLELEKHLLERYRERVAMAHQLNLPDVAAALGPLLQETQSHVRDLRVALSD